MIKKKKIIKINVTKLLAVVGDLFILIGLCVIVLSFREAATKEVVYTVRNIAKMPYSEKTLAVENKDFWIVIPKIGASSRVVADVDAGDEAEYRSALRKGVAHAKGTAYSGGFSKERVGVTTYKIKWHTPNTDDFATVIIYRGEKSDIDANSGAEVARVGGTKDTDYEWVDNGVESGKDYYYVIRAVDKAGNTSNLIGDSELAMVLGISTTTVGVSTATTGNAGSVVILPKEGIGEGQVLNESTETVEETVNLDKELENGIAKAVAKRISSSWLLSGAVILAFIAGLVSYFVSKNKK